MCVCARTHVYVCASVSACVCVWLDRTRSEVNRGDQHCCTVIYVTQLASFLSQKGLCQPFVF